MNRLRDMQGDEPLVRRGTKLLQKTPSTSEAEDVEGMKVRVWRSIRRAPATTAGGARALILKLAVVAIVALAAGTAGAVIANRWIASRPDGAPSGVRSSARSTPPRPVALAHPRPEQASPIQSLPPAAAPSPKPAKRSAPRKVASPPPSAAAVARERTEVLDALIALRRERDPVRAGTLLARYLSAHPHGTLREEALVLAIEAADGRGDRPAAERLARVYQSELPAGRFLPFARSHTAGSQAPAAAPPK